MTFHGLWWGSLLNDSWEWNSWNIWRELISYLIGECSDNLGLLNCFRRSFQPCLRAGPQRGRDPVSWAVYWIYFPSSERWKSLEKLPPYASCPFPCSSLALKKNIEPSLQNGMKGSVRSPAQVHLPGQCWPERTPWITCPSSSSVTFHQTKIGNSPRWAHSQVVFSGWNWNKNYTEIHGAKGTCFFGLSHFESP